MHLHEYIKATGITSLYIFIFSLYLPILSPYMKTLGFDKFKIGLLLSIFPLMVILFSSFFGKLSDKMGRRSIILVGFSLEILAMILYMVDQYGTVILLARALDGIAWCAIIVAGISKIEDVLEKKERGYYAGYSLSLVQLSRLAAPVIGGFVADYYFIKAPFIISLILFIFASVFLLLDLKYHVPKKSFKLKKISKINFLKEIKKYLSNRKLRGMGVLGIVMHASNAPLNLFMPLLILEKFGLSYKYIGIAFFVYFFFHLFQFVFGKYSDKHNRQKCIVTGTIIFGCMLIILSMMNSYYLFLLILLIAGIGTSLWNISALSFLSDIGERLKKEGAVMGSYFSIAKIGSFVSHIVSGLIAFYLGIEFLFIVIGLLIIVFSFIAYDMMKDRGRG